MTNRTGSEIEGGELTTPAYKDPRKDLANRSIAAAKWNYLGVVTRIAAQFISQIALARLLGPEQIGLFAFAVLLIGLGSIVVDLGLGAALVQAKRITRPDVRAVATWTFVAGVIVTGTLFICAPLLAVFFADIRTVDILRAISPVFIFQALAVVPVSLLKRELAFKQVQIAQVISYVLGFLFVGIGSAYLGAGVWSLVAAWLTQSATWAALLHLSLRRITKRPSETASDRQPSKLRGFSIQVLLTNLANWVIENADNLVVGKLFGAAALGLYSISYNLVRTPANSLVATLQAVLFAASSRAQDQQESLRREHPQIVAALTFYVNGFRFCNRPWTPMECAMSLLCAAFRRWTHGTTSAGLKQIITAFLFVITLGMSILGASPHSYTTLLYPVIIFWCGIRDKRCSPAQCHQPCQGDFGRHDGAKFDSGCDQS